MKKIREINYLEERRELIIVYSYSDGLSVTLSPAGPKCPHFGVGDGSELDALQCSYTNKQQFNIKLNDK